MRHVPFTAIRRTIGRNLTASLATAAHTLVVVEVDYAQVAPVKEAAGLTYLPFVARAVDRRAAPSSRTSTPASATTR